MIRLKSAAKKFTAPVLILAILASLLPAFFSASPAVVEAATSPYPSYCTSTLGPPSGRFGVSPYMGDCVAGYNAGLKGSSSPCNNNPYNSSSTDKKVCNDAYTAGQKAAAAQNPGNGNGNGNGNGGGGGGSGPSTTCESQAGAFGWALCPIYEGLEDAEHWALNDLILPLLTVDPICTNAGGCGQSSNVTYQVWSNFRIYADVFLVIALLVVVFGESLGGGMIDAYTAKKVLPRLLAAAILINLSIYIVALLVDVFNVIGGGIGALITAPLQASNAFKITLGGGAGNGIGATGIVLLAGGGLVLAGATAGVIMFLVGLLITGALALLGVFATLVIRQTIITALIFVAPIAFALWCLPNTEKWFKRWWDILFQMLIAYPLIIILFAVAGVMSAIVGSQNTNILNAVVAFALVVIPLFLVPMTLRMSGSVLGQIHGAVSGMTQRVNHFTGRRIMQASGKEISTRARESARGNFFKGGTEENWRGRFNRGFHYTSTAANLRNLNGPPSAWGSSIRTAMGDKAHDEASEYMKENAEFAAFSADDARLHAAKYTSAADIGAELERRDAARFGGPGNAKARQDAITQIQRAQRGTSSDVFQRARLRAQAATGTAYATSAEMLQDINETYGDDRSGAGRALGEMRSAAMQSGRVDLGAAGYGVMAGQMEALHNGSVTEAQATDTIMDSVIDSSDPRQATYGKQQSAEQLAHAHARRIDTALNNARAVAAGVAAGTHTQDQLYAAEREAKQAIASAAGVYDAMSSASPQNARAFADGFTGNGLVLQGLPPDLRTAMALNPDGTSTTTAGSMPMLEAMERLRSNDREFAEMRHEYYSRAYAPGNPTGTPHPGTMGGPGGPPGPGAPPGGLPTPPGGGP